MDLMRLSSERLLLYSLVIFFSLLPFLFVPSVFNPYELPKFFLLVFSAELLIILFLARFVKRPSFFLIDALTWLVIGFAGITFLADVFGLDPKVSLLGSMYRRQGFLTLLSCLSFFLVTRSLFQKQQLYMISLLVKSVFITTLILCLYALYQAVFALLLHDPRIPLFQGRIVATLGNPNFLGGFLVMLLPFLLWPEVALLPKQLRKYEILLRLVVIVIAIVVIALTVSKSALIALLFVLFAYFFSVLKTLMQRRVVVIIAFLLCLFFLLSYQSDLLNLKRDSIWDNRLLIWSAATQAIVSRPIFGYGQENFALVFPKERHINVDQAHNIFLEIAVSSGVSGLFFFLAIIFISLKHSGPMVRTSLAAFLITAFFNPVSIAQLALFWILLALNNQKA